MERTYIKHSNDEERRHAQLLSKRKYNAKHKEEKKIYNKLYHQKKKEERLTNKVEVL